MKYFAYGSNLNIEHMQFRCADAVPAGTFTLQDYQLVFRYYADIIPVPGQSVTGGLWDISERDEKSLDRYEGYPILYGKYYEADIMFYRMRDTERALKLPGDDYLKIVLEGMDDFGLSLEVFRNNLGNPEPIINPTKQETPVKQAMRLIEIAQALRF